MVIESDNTTHDITLDAHLQSVLDMLHKLQAARKQETLTPEDMAHALSRVYSNFTRDFPSELASTITESSVQDLLDGYCQRAQTRKVAAPTGLGGLDKALNGGFQ